MGLKNLLKVTFFLYVFYIRKWKKIGKCNFCEAPFINNKLNIFQFIKYSAVCNYMDSNQMILSSVFIFINFDEFPCGEAECGKRRH
jgi:hypothetical protein